MNEITELEINEISTSKHSISKLMSESNQQENNNSLSEKEEDNLEELNEFLKTRVEKNLLLLNSSKDEFDKYIKNLLHKVFIKYQSISKQKLVKLLSQALIEFEIKFNINEELLLNTSKQFSIPSPTSSSSSSSSSLKHSNDLRNSPSKKLKAESFNLKPPIASQSQPYANFFETEFFRLAAQNPLLNRFPDLSSLCSTNPYFNLFRPPAPTIPNLIPTQAPPPPTPKIDSNGFKVLNGSNKNLNYSNNNTKSIQSQQKSNLVHNNSSSSLLTNNLAHNKLKLSSKLSKLNSAEIQTIKSLITSYRESASFLSRSADELEQLINEYNID